MRVLLSTYGSRGDLEPLVGLAVRLRALGAEVRVCAPPDEDFAQRLAGVGVPLVPFGRSARALTTRAPPPSSANLPRHAADLIASQFDAVTAAAKGCDALVATGVMPAAAGARSVAEKLGIRYVRRCCSTRSARKATVNHSGSSSQGKRLAEAPLLRVPRKGLTRGGQ